MPPGFLPKSEISQQDWGDKGGSPQMASQGQADPYRLPAFQATTGCLSKDTFTSVISAQ